LRLKQRGRAAGYDDLVPAPYRRLLLARSMGYASWDAVLNAPHLEVCFRYDVMVAEHEAGRGPG
jgi:hypothetical protein